MSEKNERIEYLENYVNDFFDKLNEAEKEHEASIEEEKKNQKSKKLDIPDFSLEKSYKHLLKKKDTIV